MDNAPEKQASSGRGSSDERANRLAVGLCYFADCFDVVLVGEVEDEHVVGLPVDGLLNSVRLVGDESSEVTNVAHPRDDVVPVCVFEVEVGFFGEEEGGSQPVGRKDLRQLAQEDLDDYPPDEVALVLQVDNEDSSAVDGVQNLFFSQRVGLIVEESRFQQHLES